MKKSFHLWLKSLLLCLSVCLLVSSLPVSSLASQRQEKVVRVGYPIQTGLTMKDEDGTYSGYTYDYLMEISQYTGWRYEFITPEGSLNDQITTLMSMLKSGEIDLLGTMYYDESLTDQYSYSGYCYGINYSGLFVPEDSELRKTSLYNIDQINVGVYQRSLNPSVKLDEFAHMNNLKINQVLTDSPDDFYTMLTDGRADALLSTDLAMANNKEMFPLVHFSPMPFYFTTTKGNTEIVRQLDYAISTIDQVNPNFAVQLYNQYFSPSPTTIYLSGEEKAFIQSCGPLEVVMYDNKPPFQYLDPTTGKPSGITVEVLDAIAKEAGLTFHYNTVSTYKEYIDFIESGKAHIAADALINYQDALDTRSSLTLPWYSLPISVITKSDAPFNEDGIVAIPYFFKNVIQTSGTAAYFDTVEQCMQAVQNGAADYCYAGDFCSQYLFNTQAYDDLKRMHQADVINQNLCFGIYNTDDLSLLTIFNKCITLLSKDTINDIVYRNIYQTPKVTFFTFIKANQNLFLAVFMGAVALLFMIFFYIKSRQQQRIALENERYNAISNLANEYFYEYDVREDELVLSEKCASYFECSPQISKFSKQLFKLNPQELHGIWQFGHYIVSGEEGSVELPCVMPDGSTQWFKILSSTLYVDKRKQTHVVGKITNIQDMKAEQLRLQQQASLDGLTGIYNVATIKKLIRERLIHMREGVSCALIILDIDNFKQVNDTFGHSEGDKVLVQAATLIQSSFQNSLCGRLGGDEFVIFVEKVSQEELISPCTKLCADLLQETKTLLGTEFSWSMGISMAGKGKSFEALYKEADTALYQTKSLNKNGYTFFDPSGEQTTSH